MVTSTKANIKKGSAMVRASTSGLKWYALTCCRSCFSFPPASFLNLIQVTDEETGEQKIDVDEEGKNIFQSKYTGQYVANLKDGEGVFEYPDNSKYQGNWRHDKRHGDGVYWYPNGDIYSGEWRFGTKHGRGTFIHSETNARLVGTYVDGKVTLILASLAHVAACFACMSLLPLSILLTFPRAVRQGEMGDG